MSAPEEIHKKKEKRGKKGQGKKGQVSV